MLARNPDSSRKRTIWKHCNWYLDGSIFERFDQLSIYHLLVQQRPWALHLHSAVLHDDDLDKPGSVDCPESPRVLGEQPLQDSALVGRLVRVLHLGLNMLHPNVTLKFRTYVFPHLKQNIQPFLDLVSTGTVAHRGSRRGSRCRRGGCRRGGCCCGVWRGTCWFCWLAYRHDRWVCTITLITLISLLFALSTAPGSVPVSRSEQLDSESIGSSLRVEWEIILSWVREVLT